MVIAWEGVLGGVRDTPCLYPLNGLGIQKHLISLVQATSGTSCLVHVFASDAKTRGTFPCTVCYTTVGMYPHTHINIMCSCHGTF